MKARDILHVAEILRLAGFGTVATPQSLSIQAGKFTARLLWDSLSGEYKGAELLWESGQKFKQFVDFPDCPTDLRVIAGQISPDESPAGVFARYAEGRYIFEPLR